MKLNLFNFISIFTVVFMNSLGSSKSLNESEPLSFVGRITRHAEVSSYLTFKSDEELSKSLMEAESLGSGIGGQTSKFEINSIPVFIKRIPLTKIEKIAGLGSSSNIFNLPLFYQYGVGSKGFGAWRELNSHIKASNWVLNSENQHFPILYHWRVLPKVAQLKITKEEQVKLNEYIQYWGGSESLRAKEEALHDAEVEIVLFLESIPMSLGKWLKDSWKDDQKLKSCEEQIQTVLTFMHSKGVYHFDSHFHNVLTDGFSLYFTDFGLTTDLDFDLSQEERTFISHHENYDIALSMRSLVVHILRNASMGLGIEINNAEILKIVDNDSSIALSSAANEIVKRWASTAVIIFDFLDALTADQTKQIKFPQVELEKTIPKTYCSSNL